MSYDDPDQEPPYTMDEWRELNQKMAGFVALRKVWLPLYEFASEVAIAHDGPVADIAARALRDAKTAADKVRR